MNKEIYFLLIAGMISGISLTMLVIDLTEENKECLKQYDGCLASVNGENAGDWVSVNIRDMSYERAVEVCKHEVGHEIFSKICEKDVERCFEVVTELEGEEEEK